MIAPVPADWGSLAADARESERTPPAPEARPDKDGDQRYEGDSEDDKPGLVGLEATRYGVVDNPVRIDRRRGRGVHGVTLPPG